MTKNLILAALPADEYNRLLPHLKSLDLPQGKVLYEAGEAIRQVYFLESGMASLLSSTEEGATIEVAMVSKEGMLGMPIVWETQVSPYRVMVQIAGVARVLKADRLKHELKRHGALLDLLLRYTYSLVSQIT